jgi:hypothetical protein
VLGRLAAQDCVLHVSPLVRELMAALADLPHQAAHRPRDALLGALLLEELRALARCRITCLGLKMC